MVTSTQEFPNLSCRTELVAQVRPVALERYSMAQEPKNPFWEKLVGMADEAGLSMSKLGQRVGVSTAAVRKWRLGIAKPTLETRRAIARVLNRPLSDLTDEDEPVTIYSLHGEIDWPPRTYSSLQKWLEKEPHWKVSPEEHAFLASQRLPDRLGDPGAPWWISQLTAYRLYAAMLETVMQAPASSATSPKKQPPSTRTHTRR